MMMIADADSISSYYSYLIDPLDTSYDCKLIS